jgi:predicted Zn-dependent protease
MSDALTWIIGTPIVILLAFIAYKRSQKLNKAIKEHLAEQEKGVIDPYAQLAELSRVQEAIDSQRSLEKKRRGL